VTFSQILPYLEAGRRVRRVEWEPLACMGGGNERVIMVREYAEDDWCLVDEAHECPEVKYLSGLLKIADDQVARLTRERDGLKAAYAELRAVAENNAAILDKVDAIVKAHS
jgi:hypothetical protein